MAISTYLAYHVKAIRALASYCYRQAIKATSGKLAGQWHSMRNLCNRYWVALRNGADYATLRGFNNAWNAFQESL